MLRRAPRRAAGRPARPALRRGAAAARPPARDTAPHPARTARPPRRTCWSSATLAEAARLARVEIQPRPPAESGTRGEVVLDVSALGGLRGDRPLLRKVGRLAPAGRRREPHAHRDDGGRDPARRRAALPVLAGARAAAAAAGVAARSPAGVPRARPWTPSCATSRSRSRSRTRSRARRRARRNPRLFLSELAAVVRERPVVLGYASLGEEFTIRGLARRARGRCARFESRLERGFLRVAEFLMAKQGACHRFEARGRSPVGGPDAELPVPVEDPFEQDPAALPRRPRRGARDRGEGPRPDREGPGPRAAHPAPAGRRPRGRLPGARRGRRGRLRRRRDGVAGRVEPRGDARHARRDARRDPQGRGRRDRGRRARCASSRTRARSRRGKTRPRAGRRRASP